jgi:hypothetical protein
MKNRTQFHNIPGARLFVVLHMQYAQTQTQTGGLVRINLTRDVNPELETHARRGLWHGLQGFSEPQSPESTCHNIQNK